ncbi:MAG: MFS transporter [Thermaerobacter sp.]|nr:MFS transporter [Thermaerobacter sp.]
MEEQGKRSGVLHNRNYVIMLSGQVVSQFGNAFYPLAIYWYTFSLTGSRMDLGYLGTVISLTALASMLTGVLVDRWDRRRTMIWSDVLRALLAGGLALAAGLGHLGLPMIFAFALLIGLVGNLFGPAEMSLLPNVVGMEELGAASGMNQGASAGAGLVGMSLGGFLMGVFGPALLLGIDAATFVVSFVSVGLLRLTREATMPAARSSVEGQPPSFLRELGAGLRFVYGSPFFRRLVLLGAIMNFAFMPLNVLDVVWVRQVLHLGALEYGILGAAVTIGVIAGSILAGALMQRFKGQHLILGSVMLTAIAFTAFSQLPYFVPDLVVLFFLGVGIGVVNPVAQTMFQREIPQHMMGRAVGALMTTVQVAAPLGAMLGGFLASTLPLSTVFLMGGGLMLCSLLLAVRMPVPTPVEQAEAEGA